ALADRRTHSVWVLLHFVSRPDSLRFPSQIVCCLKIWQGLMISEKSPPRTQPWTAPVVGGGPGPPGCCRENLEARVGIEPMHKGFADRSLTTWDTAPHGYLTVTRSTSKIQFAFHCWPTPALHLQSIHFPVVKEFAKKPHI